MLDCSRFRCIPEQGEVAFFDVPVPPGRPPLPPVYQVFLSVRQTNAAGAPTTPVVVGWRPEANGRFRVFASFENPVVFGGNTPGLLLVDIDVMVVLEQLPVIRR